MVFNFCTLGLLLSWEIFFLQSNHYIAMKYTPSKNEQSKWDNIVFSLIFYMSAYLLLVGSVLVIKLYWWFAFSVLDMRQRVRTCSVNCYWILLSSNIVIVNSIFVFKARVTVLYHMNRGRPKCQICPYLD